MEMLLLRRYHVCGSFGQSPCHGRCGALHEHHLVLGGAADNAWSVEMVMGRRISAFDIDRSGLAGLRQELIVVHLGARMVMSMDSHGPVQ